MPRIEDKFEAYKGKYVQVNVHLLSHLGRPKEMMYGGDIVIEQGKRGIKILQKGGEQIDLMHSFYWAPFVLMGE